MSDGPKCTCNSTPVKPVDAPQPVPTTVVLDRTSMVAVPAKVETDDDSNSDTLAIDSPMDYYHVGCLPCAYCKRSLLDEDGKPVLMLNHIYCDVRCALRNARASGIFHN